MGGFLDSIKIKKRLEAMADDAGTSVLSAVTPKSPFPLPVSSLSDTAGQKVRPGVDAAETAVDEKVDGAGDTTDGGIASANKSLDTVSGRGGKDDSLEPATVADAEVKDGADATAGSEPDAAAEIKDVGGEPETDPAVADIASAGAEKDPAGADIDPAGADIDPAVADIASDGQAEAKDENSDEAVAADVELDHEGLANTAEAERLAEEQKAAAELEAEEAAQAAGEQADDDLPEEKDEPDPRAEAEPELSEADLAALGDQHKGETDDQDKARLEFKKKLRAIDNELHHLLGGALTTKSTSKSTNDPWMAFFIASNKFKKKIAVRDLKDELAGKKKDDPTDDAPPEEAKTEEDGTPVVEEATGPESQDETEVEVAGGSLRRGTASTDQGEAVDTTGPEVGSPEGRQIFVADKNHKMFIGYRPVKDNDHTQLLGMDEIVVGGEIRVEQGKIDFMSNDRSGDQETAHPFVALLRTLHDTGGIPMNFDVYEASKKNETTAEKLLEEADKAAPEPEQVDLLAAMQKKDAWKLIAADFSEALITQVAEKQGWRVAGEQIVDATGPLDPDSARVTLQKAAGKALAAEAAAMVAAKAAARSATKGAPAAVDA